MYESQNLAQKREVLEKAQADLHRLLTERQGAKDAAEKRVADFEKLHNITAVGTRRKRFRASAPFTMSESWRRVVVAVLSRSWRRFDVRAKMRKGSSASALRKSEQPGPWVTKLDYTRIRNEVHELELVYGPKHYKLKGASAAFVSQDCHQEGNRRDLRSCENQSRRCARGEAQYIVQAAEQKTTSSLRPSVRNHHEGAQRALYDRIRKRRRGIHYE